MLAYGTNDKMPCRTITGAFSVTQSQFVFSIAKILKINVFPSHLSWQLVTRSHTQRRTRKVRRSVSKCFFEQDVVMFHFFATVQQVLSCLESQTSSLSTVSAPRTVPTLANSSCHQSPKIQTTPSPLNGRAAELAYHRPADGAVALRERRQQLIQARKGLAHTNILWLPRHTPITPTRAEQMGDAAC